MDGALTPDATQAIYIASGVELFNKDANTGAGNADTAKADYVNLDALVIDAVELLDEWQRDSTDLVVIVGRDLVHDKYFPMINTAADRRWRSRRATASCARKSRSAAFRGARAVLPGPRAADHQPR
jgi:hypothetical protein